MSTTVRVEQHPTDGKNTEDAHQRSSLSLGSGPVGLVVFAVLGIALILRTHHLTDISLTFDECCSWKISQFATPEMLDAISRDAHPPVYYFLLKGMTLLFGSDDAVLRGFSVMMGLLTIVASGVLAFTISPADDGLPNQHRSGKRVFAAILVMIVVTLNSLQVEMSMEARPYTLGTFLSVISAVFLVRALRPSGRFVDWCMFSLTAVALSLTHYYGLFTVATLYLFALTAAAQQWMKSGWTLESRTILVRSLASLWVIQLVWLPWIPVFLFQHSRTTPQLWMVPLSWEILTDVCYRALSAGRLTLQPSAAQGLIAVLFWGGLSLWAVRHRNREFRLIGMLASVPLISVVAYALTIRNIIGVKYLIFGQLFLLIAACLFCATISKSSIRLAVSSLLLLWTGYWSWDYAEAREYLSRSEGVKGAVAKMEQTRKPGEPVVVGSPFVHPIVQKYVRDPSSVYSINHGDHRNNILSGPALRESDYWEPQTRSNALIRRIWTIDSFEMFGRDTRFEVHLPETNWSLETQEEYRERNGISGILAVREYRSRQPLSQTK